MLLTIRRAGQDPAANLAYEEALFEAHKAERRATLLFYVNAPCVVLGRGNREGEWVNSAACEADAVPVLRRFSGGGTVYHDAYNLNFSLALPKQMLEALAPAAPGLTLTQRYIDFFRGLLLQALAPLGGGFTASGLSDLSLNGRKVSGNAERITAQRVLHHGTLMLRCPLAAIERYLPIPPNRPGVRHSDFLTGLEEEGITAGREEIEALIEAACWRRLAA